MVVTPYQECHITTLQVPWRTTRQHMGWLRLVGSLK